MQLKRLKLNKNTKKIMKLKGKKIELKISQQRKRETKFKM